MPDAMRQTAELLARKHTKDRKTIRALRKELKLALEAIAFKDDELVALRAQTERHRAHLETLDKRLDVVTTTCHDAAAIAEQISEAAAQHDQRFTETQQLVERRDVEIARLNEVVRTAHAQVSEYETDVPLLRRYLGVAIARLIGVRDLVADERATPILGEVRRALEKVAALRPINPRPGARNANEKRALDGLLDFAAHNGVFHLVNDARQDRE